MLDVDGSQGEGGGQVLRAALALSLATLQAVRVRAIRATREKPGLRRQHLAAVRAAVAVGRAEVEGAALDAGEIVFRPSAITGGDHHVDVESEGSAGLVLQTVLPALAMAKEPSSLVLEGGTHNPRAPSFEFLKGAYLPLLGRMGAKVSLKLDRAGFPPTGRGKIRAKVTPLAEGWKRLDLMARGEIRRRRAYASVVQLPLHIVERELKVVKLELRWPKEELRVVDVGDSRGPGNVLTLEIESDHLTEVFTGIGAKEIRAETVARAVCAEARAYLDAGAPVGPYLADQLLLPMALAGGGTFRTMALTAHATTQIDLLRRCLGTRIAVTPDGDKTVVVEIGN